MRWYHRVWPQTRHHLFKGSAFVVTIILFVAAFVFAPELVTLGLDWNHELVKDLSAGVKKWDPIWGNRFELFLRFFNLDRILLFSEAVFAVKLIMLACGAIFRSCVQKTAAAVEKRRYRHRSRTERID